MVRHDYFKTADINDIIYTNSGKHIKCVYINFISLLLILYYNIIPI